MVSISSLLPKLRLDYPDITFTPQKTSYWSSDQQTVYYVDNEPDDLSVLLHELGHALLGHTQYRQDIELLPMERAAWDEAVRVAASYQVVISPDVIEQHLDSYREWMHARSRCPRCLQAGVQERKTSQYRCLLCHTSWLTNEAKQCGLKRYVQIAKTSA